jgi:hypothetical protein
MRCVTITPSHNPITPFEVRYFERERVIMLVREPHLAHLSAQVDAWVKRGDLPYQSRRRS